MMRRIPAWAGIVLVMGILYLFGLHTEAIGQVQRLLLATGIHRAELAPPPSDRNQETTQVVHVPAQPPQGVDMHLQTLDGESVTLASLRGKVVFINIWATWCPPCIAEMPGIERLYQQLDPEKFAFVMLSVDQGGRRQVAPFIERKGYTFPVYLPAGPPPAELEGNSIPMTVILDKTGQVVARQEGMAEYDTPEVVAFLEGLIEQ